jgi:predicted DNA-binding transcriptional regulator
MTDERPTVRPVTLGRLVELTYTCNTDPHSTKDLETALDMSHRRARETILEATRIGLLAESTKGDTAYYTTTTTGERFLTQIRDEHWDSVSEILERKSPHYSSFVDTVDQQGRMGISLDRVLELLEAAADGTPFSFNQTSVEVVGDWAERLGRVQRNAFTGSYYPTGDPGPESSFGEVLLDAYDSLEETAGVDLRQRYLSIPQLREEVCERLRWRRHVFDDALLELCQANVGKLELSGAPMDTGAKDAALGIKQIELAESDGLISTSQSSQQVMAGIEQFDKQYYYLAVHDRDITDPMEDNE